MSGIVAIIIGYLLGSIPTAYIVTRVAAGKDIRRIGGGNVGGLNTFREVGFVPAAIVGFVDLGKAAAAVAIAHWLLEVPQVYVMLSGLAAVIGHMWMIFLKFDGGMGMGATLGVLAILMPLYGYWYGIVILLSIIGIIFIITRNVALSMGIGLAFLPLIVWFLSHAVLATLLTVVVGILIAIKFLPAAKASWKKNKSAGSFIFDQGRDES